MIGIGHDKSTAPFPPNTGLGLHQYFGGEKVPFIKKLSRTQELRFVTTLRTFKRCRSEGGIRAHLHQNSSCSAPEEMKGAH